jgi:hypothetical protein
VPLGVATDGSDLEGHGLFASATLDTGHLAARPSLAGPAARVEVPDERKSVLFPAEDPRMRIARRVAIRAVAIPVVADAPGAAARPATKSDALLRLAPGSLIMRPVAPGEAMRRMAQLVDRVPSFWLEVDGDLEAIPGRVESTLAQAGAL